MKLFGSQKLASKNIGHLDNSQILRSTGRASVFYLHKIWFNFTPARTKKPLPKHNGKQSQPSQPQN
jgi:hypothetical protein